MKKRINEIFYSLQGEGYWTGSPMAFVRFAGCNLHCDFCDTSHESFEEMSEQEITLRLRSAIEAVVGTNLRFPSKVEGQSAPRVCLTGGEPAMQLTQGFIDCLHREGYLIHIETNGTTPLPAGIDWVTFSPKTERFALTEADELKIVYQGEADLEQWLDFPATHRFLQPCSMQNTEDTIAYVLAHPAWRLSLQTHKYLKIR